MATAIKQFRNDCSLSNDNSCVTNVDDTIRHQDFPGQHVYDQQQLTIITYNMHGFNQGYSIVREISLLDSTAPDIWLLQEHWLSPATLSRLDNFPNYVTFGTSAMNECMEAGLRIGRPFGGVATLIKNKWRRNVKVICTSERCVVIKVFDCVIINVYMPCSGTVNRVQIVEENLELIRQQFEIHGECQFILGGDFNSNLDAASSDPVTVLLRGFLQEYGLVNCDPNGVASPGYTFCNESANRYSYVDHFLVTDINRINNYEIMERGSNLSDHLPVTIKYVCNRGDDVNKPTEVKAAVHKFLRWDKANLALYYQLTGECLQNIMNDLKVLEQLNDDVDLLRAYAEKYYKKTVEVLCSCANVCVPERKQGFYKFWWTEYLDHLKQLSINSCQLWRQYGKPRSGPVFNKYKASKVLYRQQIRLHRKRAFDACTNELQELLVNKNGTQFWRCWKSKFGEQNKKLPHINGCVTDDDIVKQFAEYFKEVGTCTSREGCAKLKEIYDVRRKVYCGSPNVEKYFFDVELVERIVRSVKKGKAAGVDNLTIEHLVHCHPAIYSILSLLFNVFVKSGFVPDSFCSSYIIPIPKSEMAVGRSLSVEDFRGISICPVMAKVFESCIFERYKQFLTTSDNQFGFKKGVSCSHAIYSVRSVIDYYVESGSTVNVCVLDVKKAFDKVNHYGLFIKLMDREVPERLLSVLEYWYRCSRYCVKWGNVMSSLFCTECGVRQGGVLSPALFSCYVDDVVKKINTVGYGCKIGLTHVNIFMYADDIILLSPSVFGLQQLVLCCEMELMNLDMSLNARKTVCIRFGPRFHCPCEKLSTIGGQSLEWVISCRYLGVVLKTARKFSCDYSSVKRKYYRTVNSIFEKLSRKTHEDVILRLIVSKCLPIICYGLDACPLGKSDIHSLEFMFTRTLMKLFMTNSMSVVKECCMQFAVKSIKERICTIKCNFLRRYCYCNNITCHVFAEKANMELDYWLKELVGNY